MTQEAAHPNPLNPCNQGLGPVPDVVPVPRHAQTPVAMWTPICTCSTSPDPHVLNDDGDTIEDGAEEVPSDDEVNLSQGASSLPDLSGDR